jgi:hypothetical protein
MSDEQPLQSRLTFIAGGGCLTPLIIRQIGQRRSRFANLLRQFGQGIEQQANRIFSALQSLADRTPPDPGSRLTLEQSEHGSDPRHD